MPETTRLERAKDELNRRKDQLRVAAIGYVGDAAEFGERDGDAMAGLEGAALNFRTAYVELTNAEAEAEMEYIRSQK